MADTQVIFEGDDRNCASIRAAACCVCGEKTGGKIISVGVRYA